MCESFQLINHPAVCLPSGEQSTSSFQVLRDDVAAWTLSSRVHLVLSFSLLKTDCCMEHMCCTLLYSLYRLRIVFIVWNFNIRGYIFHLASDTCT